MGSHGRYALLHKIADGGTGEVFLAQAEGLAGFKRLVVLKRVRSNLWADESFRKMLIDEAHISMALHHSNIVQLLDVGMAGGRYFLAFELVDGWNLSQVLNRAKKEERALPTNLALHVMAETCRALAYAHGRTQNGRPMGIVHRDVTPHNVLLSEQGEVKLADFGIAKAHARLTTSQVGQVKGKPAYMSPEQATGGELDARSDLFAVGVMLYQLVVGELPFVAPTALETMAKLVRGDFVAPGTKNPELPEPLSQLISRALQVDVNKRFQSADELLADLEAIQRKVLEPAGQSELKAWLTELSEKDGARPVGRDDTLPRAEAVEDSGSIQLVDEVDILPPTVKSAEAPARPVPVPARRRSGWAGLLRAVLVVVAAVALAYWLFPSQPPAPAPRPAQVADASQPPASAAEPLPMDEEEQVDGGFDADGGEADVAADQLIPADGGQQLGAASDVELEPEPLDAGLGGPDGGAAQVETAPSWPEPPPGARTETRPPPPTTKLPLAAAEERRPAGKPPAPAPEQRRPASKPPAPATEERKGAGKPPAPAAADPMVSVLFESEPKGAEVSIDRRVFGKTPLPLRLKVGIAFELTFTKPGYKPQKVTYFVTRRLGQKVQVTLPPGR